MESGVAQYFNANEVQVIFLLTLVHSGFLGNIWPRGVGLTHQVVVLDAAVRFSLYLEASDIKSFSI
jgi:hypothetical protein